MTAETIGERLKRLRLAAGLSQRQLADPEQNVSYAYLSRLEAGQRQPSLRAVRVLAHRLGVNPVYLETGDLGKCPHCGSTLKVPIVMPGDPDWGPAQDRAVALIARIEADA